MIICKLSTLDKIDTFGYNKVRIYILFIFGGNSKMRESESTVANIANEELSSWQESQNIDNIKKEIKANFAINFDIDNLDNGKIYILQKISQNINKDKEWFDEFANKTIQKIIETDNKKIYKIYDKVLQISKNISDENIKTFWWVTCPYIMYKFSDVEDIYIDKIYDVMMNIKLRYSNEDPFWMRVFRDLIFGIDKAHDTEKIIKIYDKLLAIIDMYINSYTGAWIADLWKIIDKIKDINNDNIDKYIIIYSKLMDIISVSWTNAIQVLIEKCWNDWDLLESIYTELSKIEKNIKDRKRFWYYMVPVLIDKCNSNMELLWNIWNKLTEIERKKIDKNNFWKNIASELIGYMSKLNNINKIDKLYEELEKISSKINIGTQNDFWQYAAARIMKACGDKVELLWYMYEKLLEIEKNAKDKEDFWWISSINLIEHIDKLDDVKKIDKLCEELEKIYSKINTQNFDDFWKYAMWKLVEGYGDNTKVLWNIWTELLKLEKDVFYKNSFWNYVAPKLITKYGDNTKVLWNAWKILLKIEKKIDDKENFNKYMAPKLIEICGNDLKLLSNIWNKLVEIEKNVNNSWYFWMHGAINFTKAMYNVNNISKIDNIYNKLMEANKSIDDKHSFWINHIASSIIEASKDIDNIDMIYNKLIEIGNAVHNKNNFWGAVAKILIELYKNDVELLWNIWNKLVEIENNANDKWDFWVFTAPRLIKTQRHDFESLWDIWNKLVEIGKTNMYNKGEFWNWSTRIYIDTYGNYKDKDIIHKVIMQNLQSRMQSKKLLLDIYNSWLSIDFDKYISILDRYYSKKIPDVIYKIYLTNNHFDKNELQKLIINTDKIIDSDKLHQDIIHWKYDNNHSISKDIKSYQNVYNNQKQKINYEHTLLSQKFAKIQKYLVWKFITKIDDIIKNYIISEWEISESNENAINNILSDSEKMENFIDMYTNQKQNDVNKQQSKELIGNILSWKTYPEVDFAESYIYNHPKNQIFLNKLNNTQKKIWIWENSHEYNIISKNNDKNTKLHADITHHLLEIIKYIYSINNKIKDIDLLDKNQINEIKKAEEFVSTNSNQNLESIINIYKKLNIIVNKIYDKQQLQAKYDELWITDEYNDMKFQLKSINDLLSQSYEYKISKITIKQELDPIRISQMWNRVVWSCLASDSTNKRSVFPNIIDINKTVYYIYDQNQHIIWRFILALDNDLKLMRFFAYTAAWVTTDLNPYVDKYIIDIFWPKFKLWGKDENVKNIVCDKRYNDGEVNIKIP